MKSTLVPAFGAFLVFTGAHAASLTFLPVADTTLFEKAPANNMGRSTLAVGATATEHRCRGLLRFDVSSIPTNATVTGVAIGFVVIQTPLGGGEPSLFQIHRFLKPWSEGMGVGNIGVPAAAGETTWASQLHGSAAWPQPGGEADTDYVSLASSSVGVDAVGPYIFNSTPELLADVQGWVSGATTNHGWIMIALQEDVGATARRIAPRDDADFPPFLQIDYTVPPIDPTPQITSAAANNAAFELRFTVPSSYCYEVEYRDSLVFTNWIALTNICAPVNDVEAVAVDSLTNPQRFYRLRMSGRVR